MSAKPTKGSRHNEPDEQRKLYVQDDAIGLTAPWRIRDYEERGAFTDEQKKEVAERFRLSSALVDELSLLVGNNLDVESLVSLLPVSREKSVKRGAEKLEEAARLARRMKSDNMAVLKLLESLNTYFDETGQAEPLLRATRDQLEEIRPTVESLEARIDAILSVPNGAAELLPDDKRHARDMRRQHVVRSCCYIWKDAGRKVSYTTVSHAPEQPHRQGKLIELINAVVLLVTDPPTQLSPETIRRDIDVFNRLSPEEA